MRDESKKCVRISLRVRPSTVLDLNNTYAIGDPTSVLLTHTNIGDVHPSIQRGASGEVDEVRSRMEIAPFPGHFVVIILKIGPGSA